MFVSPRAGAQQGAPLGTAQLQVSGARLSIYRDSVTTDAEQTINVGEPARVRTCYGTGACGSAAAGSVPGLKVVGELTGPELPQAIAYETAPGGTFFLPGFQREGEYLLENVRLVDTATGHVLANADPSLATLHVRQILLASATVTRLTLADLQARGITLTQQSFNAFSFAVGFAFSGTTVIIELPVLYEGNGLAQMLDKPKVTLDGLPADVANAVKHWEPPNIVPFQLNAQAPSSPSLGGGDDELIDPEFPLFGAIVLPGNVSFLNQFFDAKLIVANGAPNGSSASLTNVTGALKLPSGEVLRLAATAPPIAVGQKLPLLKANGVGSLGPGEQGTATWTVEGLVPGTHVLRMDIAADLVRPGRAVLSTGGVVQAAVEVVDARFQLAFNHPDVVRDGEPYSLYVTVTNLSRATQNLVTVDLASESITGAHKQDPSESFAKTIPTLEPGASETLEYQLVADLTGQCAATTFQASGGLTGTIHLRTGVGEAGIPLSPASLVLPRFTDLLPKSLVTANVRFLGLAYSLALAPAGAAPAGLPHVLKSDVERRAVDLGEAGQRLYLQERLLESLEVLALDQLGNRQDLADYDTLRRSLARGAEAATALGDLFRQEQLNRNLAAADFVDHFAATTDYGRPYLAAALVPNGSQPAPVLEVRQVGASGTTFIAYTSDDAARLRTIPYGEIYALADVSGGTTKMPFALVGRLDPATSYRVDLHAPATAASGRLILLVPTDDLAGFRKVDFGFVSMGANEVWEVRAVKAAGDAPLTFGLTFPTSGLPVNTSAPAVTVLQLPPFHVVGAVQDPELDRYGLGISYLFNRPPDKASAETPASYAVRSTFHGQDTSSPAVTVDRVATKAGAAAFWQANSERVVNVRYLTPISALNGLVDGIPVIRHEHLLVTNAIRDTHGTPLDPQVPGVVIDPNRTGGLADGRVLLGDGTPSAGARVQLLRWRHVEPADGTSEGNDVLDLVAEVTTGADGAFYFDFIEEPPPPARTVGKPPDALLESVKSGFTLRATVPAGSDPILQPEEVEEVSTKIRLQNRLMHVNIALLGRGIVKGRLVYADNGAPVTDGTVAAASTLFVEQRTVQAASDGSFTLGGLPVGPITLSGRDGAGNRAYQTVGIQRPGDTVNVTLQLGRTGPPKTGTVSARILRLRSGSPRPPPVPSPGANVAVYSNGSFIAAKPSDSLGNATFTGVPAGKVTVQAADFAISRTPALTDLTLAADATVSATLTLADSSPRSVVGRVLFHDGPTNTNLPVSAAVAFIAGPGVFAYTDSTGTYRIEGVPVQGAGDAPYAVTAFDNVRGLQGQTALPPILDAGDGTPVLAADIFLVSMSGGIDGVVLDPLGRPASGVAVTLGTDLSGNEIATTSAGDGRFGFDNIFVGSHDVLAHMGDGLVPGKVGYFGLATATIVFGGHRPFVSIRMVGSGVVNVYAHTASSSVLAPVFYRPTVVSASGAIGLKGGEAIQTTTDQGGRLTLVLPVGRFTLTAVNPFNGNKSFDTLIAYPGQVVNLDVSFDTASTVTGHVVGVDGVTPVPNADVSMAAKGLLPQNLKTDGQGAFRFELVPQGNVSVTTAALVGSVDRVGRADGLISGPGQTLDLTVVMKAQGTVRGRVVDLTGGAPAPLPFAQYYVRETGYPNRRLPSGTGFFSTDAQGQYEVAHLFAGPVSVVARDRNQVTRQGGAFGEITSDFQVVVMPDIVMTTSVGSIGVTVRDPDTGAPVPDSQVTLSSGDVGVADANGQTSFDALPLAMYSIYAFHAPTGRGGVLTGLRLQNAGDRVDAIVTLDTRGQISGTLFDDLAKTVPVGGGIVRLSGTVNGRLWGTTLTALATTSSDPGTLGDFLFDGIPPGAFSLLAGVSGSNRQAGASVTTTATAPVASVDLVLEPVGDRYVRLFESLTGGVGEINPANGIYSVRLLQTSGCPPGCLYDFTTTQTSSPYPGHLFRFPDVLTAQSLKVTAQESSGKQRTGSISGTGAFAGAGTSSDPYRLVLRAKGRVVVTVRDALNAPAPANVTIDTFGGHYEAATDGLGAATFDGVLSGDVRASARVSSTGFGGIATGTLLYDDQTLALSITLAPAVSAHGVVYHPPSGDVWNGDVSTLTAESGAIVQIRDSGGALQIVATGADGTYRFSVLRTGAYTINATDATGQSLATGGGSLVGPDGNDNALPPLVLDASPPRIVSIVPPPGQVGVSRNAPVEITFSEALLATVLPTGGATSPYFTLRSATGFLPAGAWTSLVNGSGQQVVRFTPSVLYDNSTVYSLTIAGGASGVRDGVGRPLTSLGDVGSNFTTSDTVGPIVVGTAPSLDRPVDPVAPVRFDFSEAVTATPQELDGSGATPAAQLFWQQNGSPDWQPVPITMFLSRGGYSLVVQPPTGVTYQNDSLRRSVHLSRLRDATGNPMADYDKAFRVYDQNPPHVDVAFPPGAPAGQLVGGTSYTLTPSLSSLDDLPQGDVDRVEYTLGSLADPASPAATPVFTAWTAPFAYTFVAAYTGNGIDPRPFTVWVKAFDTSTNVSNLVSLPLVVVPNAPPVVGSVTAAATLPVSGTFYAGSTVTAAVAGVSDPDGAQVTLTCELRRDDPGSPNNPADLVASLPSQVVTRPAGGWAALAPPVFTSAIPISTAEGTLLFLRVKATDALGASVTAESARFAVAHDPNPPAIDSFVAHLSGVGTPASQFFIGQKLVLEFRARDTETAVRSVSLTLSSVFASPQTAALVAGTSNLYRTAELTVPATVPSGGQSVTATASATDWGGNTGTSPLAFNVSPTPDPYAPVVTWLTPWEGGAWPSGYTSAVSAQGAALLLRVRATDLDRVSGSDVPGTIVSVQLKGPVDAAGTLAAAYVDGSLVAGTGAPGAGTYESLWHVPNGVADGALLPFEVRVVDTGGNAMVAGVHLRAVRARKVYEASEVAVLPADAMLPTGGAAGGPVFLLDGATVSLYPQTDSTVRTLASVFVYAGGQTAGASFTPSASVLTAPEVTSYASSVLYNPLELAVTDAFGLGHGARVEMTAKGLLGSTATQSMILPGQTGAQQYAGGSHGGSGMPGSPNIGWARTDLTAPGSVYDLVKDPSLPGGGGGPGSFSTAGGTGGGVVRLLSPGAVVHLEGDVLADGVDGPGGGIPGYPIGGGGAGGTIRIIADRLEGAGRLSAAGGRGTNGYYTGGGGGGRIALSFADPSATSVTLDVHAPGGANDVGLSVSQLAGAGTIYLEELDALGAPKAPGRLIVTNASGKPAWPTPLGGEQRFGTVEAHGASRLVFDGDLIVGPADPGVLNDRTSVSLDAEARLMLKNEGPQVSLAAAPDGGNVSVSQTLSLTWTASDPIGLASVTKSFTPQSPATTAYDAEPLSVTQGAQPLTLTVPGAQPPGPITYALTATDRAGRVTTVQKSWNVLANLPPTGTLIVPGGTPTSVLPGTSFTLQLHAEDAEALSQAVVRVAGAATPSPGTIPLSGTVADASFTITLAKDAPAGSTVTVQVDVVDSAGARVTTNAFTVTVLADTTPPNFSNPRPPDGALFSSGLQVTVGVDANDEVGVASVDITVDSVTTTRTAAPYQIVYTTRTVSEATTVPIQFVARDYAGNSKTLNRTITIIGPPSKLAFGTQPSDTTGGASITPAVTVRILDNADNQTASTAPVTVAIGTNPGGATLSGTLTVAAVAGVATFGNLSIDRFGTGYTLTAAGAGLTGATSSPFNISGTVLVETAPDGRGTVVAAQSITAGSSLTVYAVSRDTSNNFVANVVPDSWSLASITGGVAAGDLVANAAGSFTEFPIPTSSSQPWGIAAGPDGNLWLTEYGVNKIGRITTSGVIAEFQIPTAGSHPSGIAAGPDGNLWFTEYSVNKIGRITPAGTFAEFPVPTAGSGPYRIAAGSDGNLWFTEDSTSKIGQITPAGVITEFPIPTAGSHAEGIAAGPDGNLWFTENSTNKIGRITTSGVITEFPIPTAGSRPWGIAAGPDGNLWFAESNGNKIGRITTSGVITEFPIPTGGSGPDGIAPGPDGNLWFTEFNGNKIARITTEGVVTEFSIPTATSNPLLIVAGPDGNLWFTEFSANKIGRIATGVSATFTGHLVGSAAIHAAKAGLTSTDSGTLTVVAGAASKLAFGAQPSSTIAGSPITPAVTVRIVDAGGNLIASAASVTVAIGTNPGGGTLSGTLTVAAVGGVATFSGLSIEKAGTGYALTAASSGLTGATSSSFDIMPRSASQLAFGTPPSNTPMGSAITPAVTVRILDDGGNLTASTAPITVAIGTNPASGTLSGALTVAAVAGVATFGDLSINRFGAGYTLTAASAGLTGTMSGTFSITARPATKILVETAADGSGTVVPAQNIAAGTPLTVYAISRDASDYFVANVTPDSWSLTGVTGGVVTGDLVANAVGTFAEFPIPTANSQPNSIAAGPDGNLWFAEYYGNKIGRISPSGVITEFPIPTAGSHPSEFGIAAGPDGNLWFTEMSANKIGRITTAGVVTEFPIPTTGSGAWSIAAGPNGNLWFTEYSANKIGRITTAGVVTEFPIPTAGSSPTGIAAGPDGNLWFTEQSANKIGRITTAGVVTEFPIPTASSLPYGIAAGPDGNIWFTEFAVNKIGRITPAGVATEFPIPTPFSQPYGIAAGPDGNIWFVENSGNRIGRVTTAGVFTEFPIPTALSTGTGIAAGPDGNIWFVESLGNKIGRIATGGSATFTGHLPGSAAIHAAKVGLTSTDSGTLTVPQGSPSKLVFGTPPSTTSVGSVITPPVTVKIVDESGYQPTTSTAPVTLAIGTNPGGGTLSGTQTVAAVAGVGTFSDLSIDRFGTGYTLTATSTGLTGATSITFNITAGAATKILVETAANGSGTVVPAQSITAGSSLAVYAIARDANGNFVGNVAPDDWSLANIAGGVVAGDLVASALGAFTEFPIPTANSGPFSIAAGPDGNIWFAEYSTNKIGRITPSGVITEFPIPTAGSHPSEFGIAAGPDGNLWFAEYSTNKVGRITPTGVITEFTIPTASSYPHGIAAGRDGNIWFGEYNTNKIGRITPAGVFTEFPIPTASSYPYDIVAGPDGNLWFTEYSGNKIGRITPTGAFAEFPIPTASGYPYDIAAGLDGNLWFTEHSGNKIGRITPTGVVTEFPIPTVGSLPYSIAAGPDGNLWFTEGSANKIGRIATGGSATFTGHLPGSAAIHAVKGGLASTDSGTLTVLLGPASKLAFGIQPASTTGGSPIAPAVTVRIVDAGGNLTASTAPVTVAIGANPGGGTLSGTLTVAAVAGVATFSDLSIDKVGTGYTLTVASAGLTGATSASFNVTLGPVSKLAIGTQPTYTPVGSVLAPAVTVRILDAGGNLTASTAPVTVAIGTNPGGGTLSGSLTVAAVAGVATFSDLSIDKVGTGYTLTAASAGLTGATSVTFKVTAGPAAKILVETAADGSGTVVPAQNLTAGSSLTVFAISRDASNNFVANVTPDSWSLAGITGGVVAGDLVANAAGAFSEFTIPTPGSQPGRIATGPDGNLWFTELSANKIGRITPAGLFTEFPIPTSGSGARSIAAGPDGNLWFEEYSANKIGRITPAGVITEFPIPTSGSGPWGIAAGPDGNLWFTEYSANKIGRITTAGIVTEFPVPTASSGPWGIAAGPDGNLWFTEYSANKIGRITTAGIATEFPVPTASSGPWGIAVGPDGNLWFTEYGTNKIGRITPAGVFAEFAIPTASSGPYNIAAGPDGNLWFTEYSANKIGRITTAGVFTEFAIPTASSRPDGIAAGPNGNLWFTESNANKTGQIAMGGSATFTGHQPGSAAIHASKAGLTSTDSGTLTVVTGTSVTGTPSSILGISLCAEVDGPLKPGSSFAVCADTDARDLTLEISGAFDALIADYGNCRASIAIPGSARPGPLRIVATARDAEGRAASATARALVVADELAPVLVSVEPAPAAAFRSGDPLRVAVETWDDVAIASVAITLGGQKTILTAPPYELLAFAPPVAGETAIPVLVEVVDPSGNVSRRALDLSVLPAGARLPAVASVPVPGVSFENGRLAVDGGWPWRDADGETRGRMLELPAIGTHTALAVDGSNGAVVALDGPVATAAVHGGAVDVRRGSELVGRFRIEAISEDGLVLRLEDSAAGKIREGDSLEGNWAFDSLDLTRGARLMAADVVEARTIHVDASSSLLSKNLQIPSPVPSPRECPQLGSRPDPPGTAPSALGEKP